MAKTFDDVSMYTLSGDREHVLLTTQTECTFMWVTKEGEPVGVIMNFVWHDGKFWLTATRRRKRIAAIERNPAVAVAISSRGTDIGISQAVTYKGRATVHEASVHQDWFYPALAARVRPDDAKKQAAFIGHLDAPGRVIIEIEPTVRIGFDAENMFAGTEAGATTTRV
jgi:hypothetical protein